MEQPTTGSAKSATPTPHLRDPGVPESVRGILERLVADLKAQQDRMHERRK